MSNNPARTAVILQPGYLPWLGFFEQMYCCDIFVVYDDVQYDKHSWRNRNRIKTSQGWQWLSVPVLTSGHNKPINKEILIDNSHNWRVKHHAAIQQNYSKAAYFSQYFDAFDAIYKAEWKYLIDLDMALISKLCEFMGLQRQIVFASDLNIGGRSTERLIAICHALNADSFYEGKAGETYIAPAVFQEAGVRLIYQDYHHPVYRQQYGKFIPYMSTVDLLFNHGPDSLDILSLRKTVALGEENQT